MEEIEDTIGVFAQEAQEAVLVTHDDLVDKAIAIAKKIIRPWESLSFRSYPDPDSEMGKALTRIGKAREYREGKYELPEEFLKLNPEPVTIGYGQTFKGLKLGTEWTLQQCEEALEKQLRIRVQQILKVAPLLGKHSPEKLAACLSLQYNIGQEQFAKSTLVKYLNMDDMQHAAAEFSKWNIDNGHVVQGLTNRRMVERDLFVSVKE